RGPERPGEAEGRGHGSEELAESPEPRVLLERPGPRDRLRMPAGLLLGSRSTAIRGALRKDRDVRLVEQERSREERRRSGGEDRSRDQEKNGSKDRRRAAGRPRSRQERERREPEPDEDLAHALELGRLDETIAEVFGRRNAQPSVDLEHEPEERV